MEQSPSDLLEKFAGLLSQPGNFPLFVVLILAAIFVAGMVAMVALLVRRSYRAKHEDGARKTEIASDPE